ncbi:hypothetical protein PC121_g16779 [Phytophthora cactorum]|nr:hypothetical protein PC120_g15983 [Phytophthora cactorum]KAG3053499.1 hypothetical protein PC121_g16779 [Phytophthora cactorum]
MAVVNAYIVYREARKKRGANSMIHAEFLTHRQAQMLELTEEDFAQRQPQADAENVLARTLPAEHVLLEKPDYQIFNGQRKRHQRQCKVCSNRKRSVGKRQATKYYCPGCSPSDRARTYLCNKIWPHYKKKPLLAIKYGTSYGIMAKIAHALVVGETYRIVKPG